VFDWINCITHRSKSDTSRYLRSAQMYTACCAVAVLLVATDCCDFVLHISFTCNIDYLSTAVMDCMMWPQQHQRWSDSDFLLSDPILILKNDISIRSESCFGWNHTIRIWKLTESVLRCTTYIFVLCLFCLMRLNNFWSYFAFSWTRLVEVVTWQVWNAYLA